jgi:hypothetical protein
MRYNEHRLSFREGEALKAHINNSLLNRFSEWVIAQNTQNFFNNSESSIKLWLVL